MTQAQAPMSSEPFQLGNVFVDPGQNMLRIDQREITLQNKVMHVLVVLRGSYPQTCSRQNLIEQVWDGNQYSGEKALTNAIYKLRESGLAEIIKTVTKQGYCLTLPPSVVSLEPATVKTKMDLAKTTKNRYRLIIISLIVLIIMALLRF